MRKLIHSYKRMRHGKMQHVKAHVKSITFKHPTKLPEGVSQKAAREVVHESIAEISKELSAGHSVFLPGLGKLKVKHVPAKKGGEKKVFPATGKTYITKAKPASKKIKFFAAKALKEKM